MNKINIDENILDVVKPAKKKENGNPIIVMKIWEKIISGKQTELITAPCSLIINLNFSK